MLSLWEFLKIEVESRNDNGVIDLSVSDQSRDFREGDEHNLNVFGLIEPGITNLFEMLRRVSVTAVVKDRRVRIGYADLGVFFCLVARFFQ